MNSLVGYGVSSGSEGEEEGVNERTANSLQDEDDDSAPVRKSRNFLLESDAASSESDSSKEDQDPSSSLPPHLQTAGSSASSRPIQHPPPTDAVTPSKKLPPPTLTASSDCSVFSNPFKTQADQKLSALQKHVPLTMQAKPAQIGGRKVCVSYRKDGRCRFGIKCKFAHDSDLQTAAIPGDCQLVTSKESPGPGGGSQRECNEKEAEQQQMKKRRVGLSNSLIPPKRALKQYSMQRDREHINMSR
ncbi:PREDICTED: uncharacterized protein LOC107094198 [Cyprinodon variegatus]|uniref:Si:ch211-113e8.11 n=1 Tax=Cyprinodon variegatus TaxID=28743 RepID=A0A3Q2EFN6_CYPVA|nr:PREDICTED: uncharacterized protein LOC107094198 [Cyprinodon variegatus]